MFERTRGNTAVWAEIKLTEGRPYRSNCRAPPFSTAARLLRAPPSHHHFLAPEHFSTALGDPLDTLINRLSGSTGGRVMLNENIVYIYVKPLKRNTGDLLFLTENNKLFENEKYIFVLSYLPRQGRGARCTQAPQLLLCNTCIL